MKTKQLAYVLIKVLGLAAIVLSIPLMAPTSIVLFFDFVNGRLMGSWWEYILQDREYFIVSPVLLVLGIVLIIFGRMLADMMFKEEGE